MSVAMAGLTADEVQHEVLGPPRGAFAPVEGLLVVERPGWFQLVMPAWTNGGLNCVALTVVPEDEIEAVIERTIAQYTDLGLKFRWVVDPESRPLDLAERLARHGLVSEAGRAMACPTASAEATRVPDLTVDAVTLDNLPDFERVMAEGWAMDPAAVRPYHLAILAEPVRFRMYVARWRGALAGCAAQTCFTRSTFLTGGVVLPEFRGRGVYRALVAARLRDAAASGVGLATTHARVATSAPILARVGFATVCELLSFNNG